MDFVLSKFIGLGRNPFNLSVLDHKRGETSGRNTFNVSEPGGYSDIYSNLDIETSAYMSNSHSISDFNNDGYPDLFIGKDFIFQDEFYLNDQNGSLVNKSDEFLAVNSMFSMGTDVADIDNDGYQDLIVMDMLSPDHLRRKLNTLFFPYTFHDLLNSKQTPQYQRNTLQLNRDGQYFSESSFAFDVAATEWSWTPIFMDLDLDGYKDLFITNGVRKDLMNLDMVANYLNGVSLNECIENAYQKVQKLSL